MGDGMFLLQKTGTKSLLNCLYDSVRKVWWNGEELKSKVHTLSLKLRTSKKLLIFCYCQNTIGSVLSYLSLVNAGHALALFDSKTNRQKRGNLISLYKPDMIICPSSTASDLDGEAEYSEPGNLIFDQMLYRRKSTGPSNSINKNLALLLSTSGSTGNPKLVRLSRENVEANARSIAAALKIDATERAITSLPIHYSFGLSVLNSHLVAGGSVVLNDSSPLERSFWEIFRELNCTSFAGVPFLYQLLDRIHFAKMNLPSLRTMTQAGGKMSEEYIRKFHKILSSKDARLVVMYGQTEATARMSCMPHESLHQKIGSVGVAIPQGKIQIKVENEITHESNQVGEIVYSGPNVMMGYATSREDLSRGNEMGSVLATGDMGYLDQEGYLYVTGRKKRFSKLFGLRINLDDIERFMNQYGPTAVVGNDERLWVFCSHGDEKAFQNYARELSQTLNVPFSAIRFDYIKSIPFTSSGKVDYRELEALVWN